MQVLKGDQESSVAKYRFLFQALRMGVLLSSAFLGIGFVWTALPGQSVDVGRAFGFGLLIWMSYFSSIFLQAVTIAVYGLWRLRIAPKRPCGPHAAGTLVLPAFLFLLWRTGRRTLFDDRGGFPFADWILFGLFAILVLVQVWICAYYERKNYLTRRNA